MNKLKQVFCDQSIHHFVLTTSMLCQLCKVWQKLWLPLIINQITIHRKMFQDITFIKPK